MHLMNFSRPDIEYAVCRLSIYAHNPNNDHWSAFVRLMKYLKGTMNYGIIYSGFPVVLEGYNDANWISDLDEIKCTSGYVFNLGGGAVAWKSSKQTLIATSTIESKFIGLESVGKEVELLRNFLSGIPLGMQSTPSVSMHCDCQAAISIARNKAFNGENRHIHLRLEIVKQLLKDGIIGFIN